MVSFKSRSQSYQDLFVIQTCGSNGTYIEIGANSPTSISNTYNLECHAGWKGFSIEFDTQWKKPWEECKERTNKIYWADALNFNYLMATEELNLPKHINYLSCDIEPPHNTFTALRRVIEQGLTFDCITFEHDKYQSTDDYDSISKKYLSDNGYTVAVYDVYYKNRKNMFETWFVKNDLHTFTLSFDEWKDKFIK